MAIPTPSDGPSPVREAPGRRVLPQYGQFLLVGLTGVVVNLIVFSLALGALTGRPTLDLAGSLTFTSTHAGVDVRATLLASVIAFAVATAWNFVLNNAWTFRTRGTHQHGTRARLGLYYVVSLGSLGINELVLYLLVFLVPPLWGQGAGIVAGSVVGFFGNRRVTFAPASRGT